MPVNNFNVGRDVAFDLFDANTRQIIRPSIVTGFDSKQMTQRVQVKGLDGVVRFAELPEGWEGTIELERGDSVLDDFIANQEASYYQGANVLAGQITETITEKDGSVTQYRFEGCAFKLSDGGSWKQDAAVKMKLDWVASKRRKVV